MDEAVELQSVLNILDGIDRKLLISSHDDTNTGALCTRLTGVQLPCRTVLNKVFFALCSVQKNGAEKSLLAVFLVRYLHLERQVAGSSNRSTTARCSGSV